MKTKHPFLFFFPVLGNFASLLLIPPLTLQNKPKINWVLPGGTFRNLGCTSGTGTCHPQCVCHQLLLTFRLAFCPVSHVLAVLISRSELTFFVRLKKALKASAFYCHTLLAFSSYPIRELPSPLLLLWLIT